MKQSNRITRAMTAAQESKAPIMGQPISSIKWGKRDNHNQAVVYRLYTEYFDNLNALVTRYFKGFTVLTGDGVYENHIEHGAVIEIIGNAADLQSIVHLAGDIRQVNNQSSVLVTWNNVSLLNVTADV